MASKKVEDLLQLIRKTGLTRQELQELEEGVYRIYNGASNLQNRIRQFPPKTPQHVDDIERAIGLLGNRISTELRERGKQELIFLLGVYPTVEQATQWKRLLSQELKQRRANPTNEPPPTKVEKFLSNRLTPEDLHNRDEADYFDRLGVDPLAKLRRGEKFFKEEKGWDD